MRIRARPPFGPAALDRIAPRTLQYLADIDAVGFGRVQPKDLGPQPGALSEKMNPRICGYLSCAMRRRRASPSGGGVKEVLPKPLDAHALLL
jgi:hypothetical protein